MNEMDLFDTIIMVYCVAMC